MCSGLNGNHWRELLISWWIINRNLHTHFEALILYDIGRWGVPQQQSTSTNWSDTLSGHTWHSYKHYNPACTSIFCLNRGPNFSGLSRWSLSSVQIQWEIKMGEGVSQEPLGPQKWFTYQNLQNFPGSWMEILNALHFHNKPI